jgi:hypothetical protein
MVPPLEAGEMLFRTSALTVVVATCFAQPSFKPRIPTIWDDREIADMEIPVSNPAYSPHHVSAEYYYRIPVRPIYRTYPVYAPGRAPQGYLDSLRWKEPEIVFDASHLRTRQDWVSAGEAVFDAPTSYEDPFKVEDTLDAEWWSTVKPPVLRDGTLAGLRYVIRKKGKVELGSLSCGTCHTRILSDGTLLKGGQGNFPFDRALAWRDRRSPEHKVRNTFLLLFTAQWVPARQAQISRMSVEELAGAREAIPPGALARNRSSVFHPVAVPDLFGVQQRKYLDKSGLTIQRSVEGLMRYAAMAEGLDFLSDYGGFIPTGKEFRDRPLAESQERFSEEHLYSLALYLSELAPPPNPNRMNTVSERGRNIFAREGCPTCHTPPLYTANKLLPVRGFQVPPEHRQKYDILDIHIGTDPTLALETRRGTGYYKIPSLRGVWCRGPFEHNGSVATLEDWFNPARLREDYVPTGFRGYGVKTRAVPGHQFWPKTKPHRQSSAHRIPENAIACGVIGTPKARTQYHTPRGCREF